MSKGSSISVDIYLSAFKSDQEVVSLHSQEGVVGVLILEEHVSFDMLL